jgi:hypothetical protein
MRWQEPGNPVQLDLQICILTYVEEAGIADDGNDKPLFELAMAGRRG